MIYEIYKDKTPVSQVNCSPAKFHPTVSRAANQILNKSKPGTIIYVKSTHGIDWAGKKKFKKVISGGL